MRRDLVLWECLLLWTRQPVETLRQFLPREAADERPTQQNLAFHIYCHFTYGIDIQLLSEFKASDFDSYGLIASRQLFITPFEALLPSLKILNLRFVTLVSTLYIELLVTWQFIGIRNAFKDSGLLFAIAFRLIYFLFSTCCRQSWLLSFLIEPNQIKSNQYIYKGASPELWGAKH